MHASCLGELMSHTYSNHKFACYALHHIFLFSFSDSSKSSIALLSPAYIKSKVCYEEFCLSYALFADKDRSLDLVTLLVEPVSELPLWCEGPLPIDCTLPGVDTDELLFKACIDLVSRLKGELWEIFKPYQFFVVPSKHKFIAYKENVKSRCK